MKRRFPAILRSAAILTAALLIIPLYTAGCGETIKEMKYSDKELVGIEYSHVNGMVWGDDFEISLRPDRVVYARYFRPLLRRYAEKENRALSAARWNDIGEAVINIAGSLVQVTIKNDAEEPAAVPTDGPQRSDFVLIWRDDGGTETAVKYYKPSDAVFDAIIDMLKDAAKQLGRKLAPLAPSASPDTENAAARADDPILEGEWMAPEGTYRLEFENGKLIFSKYTGDSSTNNFAGASASYSAGETREDGSFDIIIDPLTVTYDGEALCELLSLECEKGSVYMIRADIRLPDGEIVRQVLMRPEDMNE